MKNPISPFIVSCLVLLCDAVTAQVGALQIIDNSVESAGVHAFAVADLDADGNNELIAAFMGANGGLAYYNNVGNGQFSERIVLGEPAFARAVGVGFFDNDNLPDIVIGGEISPQLRLYINGENWDGGQIIDDTFLTQINDLVVADFDGNGADDIVVIGQHSIDLFRNDGNASFTKEAILTTQTSPEVLECLSIDIADVDSDGDTDLIAGETAGMVIYINDGNGIFTAHYYSPAPEIGIFAVPVDVDNDGHIDVFMKNSTDQLRWFRNNGDGTFELEMTFSDELDMRAAVATDYNHDGFMDLLYSYTNHIAVMLNDDGQGFAEEIILHNNNALIMGALHVAQLDGINGDDFIWTGANNSVAYFPCDEAIISSISLYDLKNKINVYPNPTSDLLNIHLPESIVAKGIDIVDAFGRMVLSTKGNAPTKQINTTPLAAGIYTLCITDSACQKISIPFIKD